MWDHGPKSKVLDHLLDLVLGHPLVLAGTDSQALCNADFAGHFRLSHVGPIASHEVAILIAFCSRRSSFILL
jgi:hypothetical protein